MVVVVVVVSILMLAKSTRVLVRVPGRVLRISMSSTSEGASLLILGLIYNLQIVSVLGPCWTFLMLLIMTFLSARL